MITWGDCWSPEGSMQQSFTTTEIDRVCVEQIQLPDGLGRLLFKIHHRPGRAKSSG
jgi:hypothetical protein